MPWCRCPEAKMPGKETTTRSHPHIRTCTQTKRLTTRMQRMRRPLAYAGVESPPTPAKKPTPNRQRSLAKNSVGRVHFPAHAPIYCCPRCDSTCTHACTQASAGTGPCHTRCTRRAPNRARWGCCASKRATPAKGRPAPAQPRVPLPRLPQPGCFIQLPALFPPAHCPPQQAACSAPAQRSASPPPSKPQLRQIPHQRCLAPRLTAPSVKTLRPKSAAGTSIIFMILIPLPLTRSSAGPMHACSFPRLGARPRPRTKNGRRAVFSLSVVKPQVPHVGRPAAVGRHPAPDVVPVQKGLPVLSDGECLPCPLKGVLAGRLKGRACGGARRDALYHLPGLQATHLLLTGARKGRGRAVGVGG